jgi:hypothetical protein
MALADFFADTSESESRPVTAWAGCSTWAEFERG